MAYLEISHAPKLDLKYVAKAYQEPCQTSKMECKNSKRFLGINYFRKTFDRVLNMPLYSVLPLTQPTGNDIEENL